MAHGEMTQRQRAVAAFQRRLRRDAAEQRDRLVSAKSAVADLLLAEVAERIGSAASDAVLENVEAGLNRLLGPRGQALCRSHPAREWLDSALRDLAVDFADEFAEAVAQAADEVVQEADARQAEIVAHEEALAENARRDRQALTVAGGVADGAPGA